MRSPFFSALPFLFLSAITSAAVNGGAPSVIKVTRELDPYANEILLGDVANYSIEGVAISPANLRVTETSESNCGTSEYGYQGCLKTAFDSEPAVEVRVLLISRVTPSEQSASSQWKTYFRLSDFSNAEIKLIEQSKVGFDPFGSSTSRNRELARRLFSIGIGHTTVRWNEPVFGNICQSSSGDGDTVTTQCNVIGQRSRAQMRDTIRVMRR